ncbi:MAG: YkgJ family cysteine cluster protein [Mycobacterium sp.]
MRPLRPSRSKSKPASLAGSCCTTSAPGASSSALRHAICMPRRSVRRGCVGDCVFYDKEAGCTIYSVRPRQCRTWPFWQSNVGNPEAWEETCRVCPGSGQGELISAEEITQRVKVIRI